MSFTVSHPIRTEERDDVAWTWVEAAQWKQAHAEVHTQGGIRLEWITAVHNGGDTFDVMSRIADESLTTSIVLVAKIDNEAIETVTTLFATADFHERELAQMFGITFAGRDETGLAFATNFSGHPLRRDFALASRIERAWPGAVEPDANAKRRPQLPPGVFSEWSS